MHKLIVLPIVLAVTSSFAEPRYKRETHAPPPVAEHAKPKAAPHALPGVRADDVLDVELSLHPLRVEQESLLLQLIRDTPDTDPDKPDLLLRLAEHYAIQERIWRVKSYSDFAR